MKHLLVLAGNFVEFQRWCKDNKAELKAKNIEARFVDARGTNHLGFRDCFYVEVGTFYRTARHEEVYRYFESHNVVKI